METIDPSDLRLLKELQRDASRSIREIAEAAGISQTPAWRRLKALEEAGIVGDRVALLDAGKLGFGVTVFVSIKTNQHDQVWMDTFAGGLKNFPEVVEFYRMAGDTDYLLKVIVTSIEGYDRFYKRLVKVAPLSDVSAGFAMEQIKFTTALPLELL